ncbi:MAG: phospholipase D family protein, partial [Armatimonadota bacterium]
MTWMLDPSNRQVYWEPLSPPPGYELDLAVATTYSLDLQVLIMAAVPMAFGALDVEQEGLPDQVQALASLQRVARRVTVFCQQAQIVPPGKYSRLFGLLEPVVAEVRAPRGGVFHPKMWLTRYTAEGRDPRYRLVVLSRNLTLDRSWDAMFVADGSPGHTARGYRQPLSDFIRTLPDLCVEPLADARRSEIRALSRELDDVYFPRLEGFSQMRHGPIGIRGYSSVPSGRADRRLVISPFLADHTVTELLADVGEGILVSRADALDRLEEDTLAALDHCRIHYWLDDVADEPSGDEAEEATPGYEPEAGETLHGLHAKIIVSEQGHLSRMLIGSANATDAAFGNHNVEYCLQFTARNEDFSIESIIPPEPDEDDPAGRGVLNMLMPYQRDEHFTPPPPDLTEDALRDMREQLVALDLGLAVRSVGEDTWDKGDMGVRCRYALRFGDLRSEDRTVARRGDVRQAFNSPFRPFILATTSIGQEGLDF